MNAEFFEAIEMIEKEKGIPRGYMYEKINQAMLTAFHRDNPECSHMIPSEDKLKAVLPNAGMMLVRRIAPETTAEGMSE